MNSINIMNSNHKRVANRYQKSSQKATAKTS